MTISLPIIKLEIHVTISYPPKRSLQVIGMQEPTTFQKVELPHFITSLDGKEF